MCADLWWEDLYDDGAGQQRAKLRRLLLDLCRKFVSTQSSAHEQIDQLLNSQVSLGRLVDILSFATSLPVVTKQQILSQCSVEERARTLIGALQQLTAAISDGVDPQASSFPPQFSDN